MTHCPPLPLSQLVPPPLAALHAGALAAVQRALHAAAALGAWDLVEPLVSDAVALLAALAPARAAVALALLASAAARRALGGLLASAGGPAHPDVLHAALVARLEAQWVTTGLPGGGGVVAPARGAAAAHLASTSLAARVVGDPPPPLEALLGALPYGTRLLVLQRGEGGRVLYAGVLARLPGGGAWPPGEPLRARANQPLRGLDLAAVGAAQAATGAPGLGACAARDCSGRGAHFPRN